MSAKRGGWLRALWGLLAGPEPLEPNIHFPVLSAL